MRILDQVERKDWSSLTKRPVADLSDIRKIVRPILDQVKLYGDSSVLSYTREFDGVQLSQLEIAEKTIKDAAMHVSDDLKSAIKLAAENIRTFHLTQKEDTVRTETTLGITCWRSSTPIERVGLYIPGGTAPLFSTVLMLAIPASIAGCSEIVLCSPPDKSGNLHPAILYAADLCGVHKVYTAGGAQAIAAMAYGTTSIPAVDKIFGPGNQFVTAAKQMVLQAGTSIDMPAGPSEVLVIADEFADAAAVAADLIAQAEHGVDSQVVLLTDSSALTSKVVHEMEKQLAELPRRDIAVKAIEHSFMIIFKDLSEAMAFSNLYAPEHLIINTKNFRNLAKRIRNAGSVFMGSWTPESLGDYASGTNHTLPTNGFARSYSGVSVDSFVKKITFQEASLEGLKNISKSVVTLAENEKLEGHKRAVTIRLENL